MSSVRFKLNSNKDITKDIKRFYRGLILESKDNLKGKKDGVEKTHIHAIQFPIKKNHNKQDKSKSDIYIYTDGSQFVEKDIETKKNRETGETYQKEIESNKLFGYGVFIEAKDTEVSTYGIISNLDSKFYKENKQLAKKSKNKEYFEQSYCQIIELKAIEESLLNLERYYSNINERNVFLYSDNLFNVVDLNNTVKLKILDKNHPDYKQILGHDNFLRFANRDKYELLDKISDFIIQNKISLSWVRSHQGYKQNELVDRLAKMALNLERQDFLSGTSRIEDIFANHTYTEITSKTDKPILQDNLKIKATQRFNNGESKIVIENDRLKFKHNNFTSLQVNTNDDHKIIVRSEYEINSNQPKKQYKDLTLKDIENVFQTQCNHLLGKINAANFNSSLDMIHNYCNYQNYKIEDLEVNVKSVEKNTQASQEFFNVIDNYFNIKRFKYIDNVNIRYEEPFGKVVIPRVYEYINGDTVYQLSNHENDIKSFAIEEVANMIDRSKINQLKKSGIKETGNINLVNTSILQREKFKVKIDKQLSNTLAHEIMSFRKKKTLSTNKP